ncbi:FMN-binding glutamate synthase family protein [Alicyclobacillaceae bacterium I2511]|nr:FMN-binding glutamate synthase family protein [Alicyclobacillaceae bacterium I2511]
MENELRTATGRPLPKPIGTHRPFPHFDGLLFAPAQLTRRPLGAEVPVDIKVKLGPRAARPLTLEMPVMVTAMGYGVALSKPFSLAIAKGTGQAKTAFNTGQGPVLPEHLQSAHRIVMQYHGGNGRAPEAILQQAHMVEIRFGQGANGGYSTQVDPHTLDSEVYRDLSGNGRVPADKLIIPAGLPEVGRPRDLRHLIRHLRKLTGGVPIAVKLAASHHLEAELAIICAAGADVIVLDGAQGGTFGSPGILVDDFGLPTLAALVRAVQFLRREGWDKRVDLVVSGGVRTPGDMLKAVALGAKAVYIGSAALFATLHSQIVKATPYDPPTQLAWATGRLKNRFDSRQGAASLAAFLTSCGEEMQVGLRALGKTSLAELGREDLAAWDAEVARVTGLPLM